MQSIGFSPPLWALADLASNRFKLGFDAPAYAYMKPVWSHDSRFYAISALAPEGSSWEKEDVDEGFIHLAQLDSYLHLFTVDVGTGVVSEVLHRYKGFEGSDVFWSRRDEAISVPLSDGVIVELDPSPGGWKEVSRRSLAFEPDVKLQGISRTGSVAVGIKESISTPPNLVIRDLKKGETHLLTDLNPQYRDIALGEVGRIEWANKFGVRCWGYLIKPIGYSAGERYPLVIMNKSREPFFVSDGSYTTAFPPQTLAGNGFAVLMAEYYFDAKDLPKGFPGGIAEAYNWMAMVESGVEYLANQGIVDKANVGIIGFSRTSWKTDFMLTHSDFKFTAASSADSGIYNYGMFWFTNQNAATANAEAMYGGPPYGGTLENWLKYAPAFNAQHVRCPLLMEYTGHGHMPFGPTNAYESFTALHRQNKPVELFFYPLGDHPFDTPSERVASLQRNVDWFRFWMQNYEGTAPAYDKDQYVRWHNLRNQQNSNARVSAKPSTSN